MCLLPIQMYMSIVFRADSFWVDMKVLDLLMLGKVKQPHGLQAHLYCSGKFICLCSGLYVVIHFIYAFMNLLYHCCLLVNLRKLLKF